MNARNYRELYILHGGTTPPHTQSTVTPATGMHVKPHTNGKKPLGISYIREINKISFNSVLKTLFILRKEMGRNSIIHFIHRLLEWGVK